MVRRDRALGFIWAAVRDTISAAISSGLNDASLEGHIDERTASHLRGLGYEVELNLDGRPTTIISWAPCQPMQPGRGRNIEA